MKRVPFHERYVVSDAGCWIWQGAINAWGYGQLVVNGHQWKAHRYSWERARGPIPEGLQIDHLCRVTACVNPDHLEPVTPAENVRRSRLAKLTLEAVREIRAEAARGVAQKALADRYCVQEPTISKIVTGLSWRESEDA